MTAPDDVTVDITGNGRHQARCRRPECTGWPFEERYIRADADRDRLIHQNKHTLRDLAAWIRRRPS